MKVIALVAESYPDVAGSYSAEAKVIKVVSAGVAVGSSVKILFVV